MIQGKGQLSGCSVREERVHIFSSGGNVIPVMLEYAPRLSVLRLYFSMLYLYCSSRSVDIVSCNFNVYFVIGHK